MNLMLFLHTVLLAFACTGTFVLTLCSIELVSHGQRKSSEISDIVCGSFYSTIHCTFHIIFFQQVGYLKLKTQSFIEETLIKSHRYIQWVDTHVCILCVSFGVISTVYIEQKSCRQCETVSPYDNHSVHPTFRVIVS